MKKALLPIAGLLAALCIDVACGTIRPSASQAPAVTVSSTSLADSVWTFSQSHPDGFTLNIRTWQEPVHGIAVSYSATQNRFDRADLDFVVSHARAHEGYVGGWFNSEDGRYYFDSVRLFPEDSLSQACRFGRENAQEAVFILSSGTEIRLD